MSTKNKWLIGAGIVVGLIVLFALPFAWQTLFHPQGYGMMGYGNMPMHGGYLAFRPCTAEWDLACSSCG